MFNLEDFLPPPPWEGPPFPRGPFGPFERTDICVGCGQEFNPEELFYEGVEPDVRSPRCRICVIKQAQDIFGPENVDLGPEWEN